MEKKNIFLVSAQKPIEGKDGADIKQYVICSQDMGTVRIFLESVEPGIRIMSIVPLTVYEDLLKKIKLVLAGDDKSWPVYVDPTLQMAA